MLDDGPLTQLANRALLHNLLEHTEREGGVRLSLQSLKERLMTLETYLAAPGAKPRAKRQRPIRQGAQRSRSK